MLRTKLKIFIVIIFLLMISSWAALAQEYYADLEIKVDEAGTASITGITNNLKLSQGIHRELTSKKGEYWLLNISPEGEYSDYIISVSLPEGAEFNYLKASGRSRVSYDNGIRIIVSGGGEPLSIVVQYKINDVKSSVVLILIISAVLLLFVLGFFFWRRFSKKKQETRKEEIKRSERKEKNKKEITGQQENIKKNQNEKLEVLKRTLSENQLKILDLLLEAKGELTQKQLQHRSGLAKATLSRNIELLAKKNIIIKQSRGMTNMIILNKEIVE